MRNVPIEVPQTSHILFNGAKSFGRKSFAIFTKNPQKTKFFHFHRQRRMFWQHLGLQTPVDLSFFHPDKFLKSLQSEKTLRNVEKRNSKFYAYPPLFRTSTWAEKYEIFLSNNNGADPKVGTHYGWFVFVRPVLSVRHHSICTHQQQAHTPIRNCCPKPPLFFRLRKKHPCAFCAHNETTIVCTKS